MSLSEPLTLFAALFGLVVGSFLNVVVLRFHTGMSVQGRSACPKCGHVLAWYELIPVVSFLIQRGRCRSCHSRIALQYPLIEALTGFAFAGVWAMFAPLIGVAALWYVILAALLFLIIASLLIVITVYDIRHTIIPNPFVYGFIGVSLVWLIVHAIYTSASIEQVAMHLAAGPILFAPFAFLWRVSQGVWMGLGDGKLAWGVGWLLGLSSGVASIVLAFWIGAVWGIALVIGGKIAQLFPVKKQFTMKSEIPFGPFIILATALVWWWGITLSDIIRVFDNITYLLF